MYDDVIIRIMLLYIFISSILLLIYFYLKTIIEDQLKKYLGVDMARDKEVLKVLRNTLLEHMMEYNKEVSTLDCNMTIYRENRIKHDEVESIVNVIDEMLKNEPGKILKKM